MGNKESTFTEKQLEAYEDCTFFTSKEILRIFHRFKLLDRDRVPYNMTGEEAEKVRIPLDLVAGMPELKENPFREQICKVFSQEGNGNLNFQEFLDMFSVFCEAAPKDLKTVYAFKIYDWDGDGFLSRADLETTLLKLTKEENQQGLSNDEVAYVIDKVIDESDLDGDDKLSYIEFEHVISRAPDFLKNCIRLM